MYSKEPAQMLETPVNSQIPKCENSVIGTISREELAWLAGILDGEGSLEICVVRDMKRSSLPRVRVGMNDARVIQKISNIYTALSFRYYYYLGGVTKKNLCIVLHGFNSVRKLLLLVRDFLGGKKDQANLILDYIDRNNSFPKRHTGNQYAAFKDSRDWESWVEEVHSYRSRLSDLKNLEFNPQRLQRRASKPLLLDEGIVRSA